MTPATDSGARRAHLLAALLCVPLFALPSGLPAPFCYLACCWLPLSGFAAARVWMLIAQRALPVGAGAGLGAVVGGLVAAGGLALHVRLEHLTPAALLAQHSRLPAGTAVFVKALAPDQYLVVLALLALFAGTAGLALGAAGGILGAASGRMKPE